MPTVITTINAADKLEPDSRVNINNNFASLNTNKLEVANNLSDVASKPTAINNIMPDQTSANGKFLTSNGSAVSWGSPTGVSDASTTVKGIVEISATPAIPATPIALGVNDVKCPQVDVSTITADIVGAMAGSGVPSASNKFVTADTDALKELLSNKDATTTLGTSDTKYPTQKAVKTYVDSTPPSYKVGTTTKDLSDASATQNIAHGLGRIPKIARLIFTRATQTYGDVGFSIYNGTTQVSAGYDHYGNSGGLLDSMGTTTIVLHTSSSGDQTNKQTGTITFDATNISIDWVKTNSPAGTYNIMWEVQ